MNNSSWRCENLYSDDIPRIYIGQECTTTPYSSTTTLSGTAENPIVVRDDGSLIFGLGIIIFPLPRCASIGQLMYGFLI